MWSVIALAVLMGVVSLMASFAPFYFSFNIDMLSQVAAGVILGAAFLIVIPEGIVTMASSAAGYPLLAGYIFMMVLAIVFQPKKASSQQDIDIGALRMNRQRGDTESQQDVQDNLTSIPSGTATPQRPKGRQDNYQIHTMSLGMIVHAAADGIALGATTGSGSQTLQVLVFLSIILHKAPTAFSLTSILLAEHVPQSIAWRDAIIFSSAGPIAAIIIAVLLGSQEGSNLKWWAGLALTFSGGTFGYVAIHMQQRAFRGDMDIKSYARIFGGVAIPLFASLLPDVD